MSRFYFWKVGFCGLFLECEEGVDGQAVAIVRDQRTGVPLPRVVYVGRVTSVRRSGWYYLANLGIRRVCSSKGWG